MIQSNLALQGDRNLSALLIAAAVIAAPRLAGVELKRTPAFLSIVSDSIWAAEFIMRALTERYPVPRQRSDSTETTLSR